MYNFSVNTVFKEILVSTILSADKSGFHLLKIAPINPNEQTLVTFEAFKEIYNKCEKCGLKVWVSGSWAVSGVYGDFIKNTNDIDLSVATLKDEEKLTELLLFAGYGCKGTSPFGAINFYNKKTGVAIDIGSIQASTTAFKNILLHENECGQIRDFKFRILPKHELLHVYKEYVFKDGRNAKQDLKKIKVLAG